MKAENKTEYLRAQVNAEIKSEFYALCESMNLTVSEATRGIVNNFMAQQTIAHYVRAWCHSDADGSVFIAAALDGPSIHQNLAFQLPKIEGWDIRGTSDKFEAMLPDGEKLFVLKDNVWLGHARQTPKALTQVTISERRITHELGVIFHQLALQVMETEQWKLPATLR
jgi:hypothetical protein